MLLEELMQEERAEGRAEGHNQAMSFCILALLENMKEEVPVFLREQIMSETDPEILTNYFKQAASANSIKDFLQSVQK